MGNEKMDDDLLLFFITLMDCGGHMGGPGIERI
jgi:hypothetical protein